MQFNMDSTHTTRAKLVPGARVGDLGGKKCPVCEINQWRSSDWVVVANVYVNGKWDRMEVEHILCYRDGNKTHPPEEYGSAGTQYEYDKAMSMSGIPKNISFRTHGG